MGSHRSRNTLLAGWLRRDELPFGTPETIDAFTDTMKTNELREKYLAYFESKGHSRIASDVLVPTWDPSVLFTPTCRCTQSLGPAAILLAPLKI